MVTQRNTWRMWRNCEGIEDFYYGYMEGMRELIRQIDITVNEAAKRFGIPPSTLKNILYGQSKNVGVITIKKLCDGLGLTIPEFFDDSILVEIDSEL